jgi:hypothetical protein
VISGRCCRSGASLELEGRRAQPLCDARGPAGGLAGAVGPHAGGTGSAVGGEGLERLPRWGILRVEELDDVD